MKTSFGSIVLFALLVFANFGALEAQVQKPTPQQLLSAEVFRDQSNDPVYAHMQRQDMIQRAKRNPSLFSILELIDQNPETFEGLGLVSLQKDELVKLQSEYKTQIERINSNPTLSAQQRANELAVARFGVADKVVEVLLPGQLKKLYQWDLSHGLPKVLVGTEVGTTLNLTEHQKERIKEKSDEFAKRVQELLEELRQESADVILDELTEDQLEQLKQLYTEDRLQDYFETMPVGAMYGHFLFDIPKDLPRGVSPTEKLRQTELDLGFGEYEKRE